MDSSARRSGLGLLRLRNYLRRRGDGGRGASTGAPAFTVVGTLFDEPYLAVDPQHQGLLLHSVYHRPNGWDYVPPGASVPQGESSMWEDYHARGWPCCSCARREGRTPRSSTRPRGGRGRGRR